MRKNLLFGLWIFCGVSLISVAATQLLAGFRFKERAIPLSGRVIGSRSGGASQWVLAPVVQFAAPSGELREHTYNAPLAGNEFLVGQEVTILIDVATGETKIDDFGELYLWPALLAFAAFLILLPPLAGMLIHFCIRFHDQPRRLR